MLIALLVVWAISIYTYPIDDSLYIQKLKAERESPAMGTAVQFNE